MAHDLIFYSNRNTPKVVPTGKSPGTVPAGYGKVVKRRAATADEEKVIAKGGWLRVNKGGKKPGQPGYKPGSNYRPQLRDRSNQTVVESDEDFMTESSAAFPTSTQGSVLVAVGPNVPVWKKIVRIDYTDKGPVSTVVQDYQLVKELAALIEDALLDHADDDDTPEQQRMLMSAWQALAMYLATCDDEDKDGAAIALKQVSDLMSGTDGGVGPFPDGTFGKMISTAASDNKTVYECAMCDDRQFGTMAGLVSHLQSMHNMNPVQARAKAMKAGAK